jgi:hypothetical protein
MSILVEPIAPQGQKSSGELALEKMRTEQRRMLERLSVLTDNIAVSKDAQTSPSNLSHTSILTKGLFYAK